MTDEALVEHARSFIPAIRQLFCRHLTVTAGASVGPGVLQAIAAALGDPSIPMRLVSSLGDVDSAAPSHALWQLSRLVRASADLTSIFDAGVGGVIEGVRRSSDPMAQHARVEFIDFIRQYGSRGPNEWDLRSEVWETRPELVVALIDRMRLQSDDDAPSKRNDERGADREALTAQIEAALADQPEVLGQFHAGLRSSHVYLVGRERTKTTIIRVLHEIRMAVRELGARHGYSLSGITMLLDDELDAFVADPSEFAARLAVREQQYLELFDLDPPFIIDGSPPPVARCPGVEGEPNVHQPSIEPCARHRRRRRSAGGRQPVVLIQRPLQPPRTTWP